MLNFQNCHSLLYTITHKVKKYYSSALVVKTHPEFVMVWETGDLNNTRQVDTFFMGDVPTKLARVNRIPSRVKREATNITWQRDSFVEEGKRW